MIKTLILGSGAREHALARKISESKRLEKLYISPGNPGTEGLGENVDIGNDFESIAEFVISKEVNMVIIGPEQPLVDGIWDYFDSDERLKDVLVVGPSQKAAMLEGSKDFAKEFMSRFNIPTAKHKTFTKEEIKEGKEFLESLNPPYVLKADGLAAGKGVIISSDLKEAKEALVDMLENEKFGKSSSKVIIEEYLDGEECSVFVITDSSSYKLLPVAKDYKRIGDGDTGLNTGGMGAVSPVRFADKEFIKKVEDRIIRPTLMGLREENIFYQGFIFFGIMNVDGNPYMIEYNVRLGDPEAESILPRIKSDLLDTLESLRTKSLSKQEIEIDPRYSVSIIMASGGYPEEFEKGKLIKGHEFINNSIVFHAGTKKDEEGNLLTNGGRVMAITSLGYTLHQALKIGYESVEKIEWENKYYRKDIGK